MLYDLEKHAVPQDHLFDICIIGSGAAGLVLAGELSGQGKSVLLLEGGGTRFEERSQSLYNAEISGAPYGGPSDGRIRMLGGTTTQWGGQILEPEEFIFRPRSWVRGSGWPIEKSALEPYYRRAEGAERIANAAKDASEIWGRLGLAPLDFSGSLDCEFSRFCPTTNFAALYADLVHRGKNVSVFVHANACELILDDADTTARSITCRTLTGRTASFSARAFVLCMGGIENSRFLLQPRQSGTPAPWNRHGLVGRHYQDHISGFVADLKDVRLANPQGYFDFLASGGFKHHLKMKLPRGLQEEHETLDICGTVSPHTDGRDDLARAYESVRVILMRRWKQLSPGRVAHLAANLPRLLWHKLPYGRAVMGGSKPMPMRLGIHCEQSPLSDGFVSLGEKQDALGQYVAKVQWSISEAELRSVQFFIEHFRRTFRAANLGEVVAYPEIAQSLEAARSRFVESSHHIGGTKMAATETEGVVDPDLKLFGTTNVFACGSSVFPCAGFVNPTHTIVALAIRLGDHLEEVFRHRER